MSDYGARAHQDLIVTRGAGFRKEKNKKKRGSYRGGDITVGSFVNLPENSCTTLMRDILSYRCRATVSSSLTRATLHFLLHILSI